MYAEIGRELEAFEDSDDFELNQNKPYFAC